MPSVDPITGKQLSGAQKAKAKREREIVAASAAAAVAADAAALAVTDKAKGIIPLDIEPPPQRVDAVAMWAQIVCQRVSAMLMRDGAVAIPTAMTAVHVLRQLPKMRTSAHMSEMAIEVENDGRPVVIDDKMPPLDPLAGPAWAYRRVATIAYELLTNKRPVTDLPLAAAEIETCRLTCQFVPGHLIDVIVGEER